MSEGDMNKIESLIGYLQPLYDDLDVLKKMGAWHFMPDVIEEADQWLSELKDPTTN